jgi:hypothetical protein
VAGEKAVALLWAEMFAINLQKIVQAVGRDSILGITLLILALRY